MRELGIGLIGTGFMGKAHALAYGSVRAVMGDVMGHVPAPRLEVLCDTPTSQAAEMASQFGFSRATDDWQALVNDARVDVVSITTPNHLHHEMALAAIAAGKHVYCEKPLSLTLEQAAEMARAAQVGGVKTQVGYNYIQNPAFVHACQLVRDGAIGRIVHFRGCIDEDYQADPDLPWTWRAKISQAGLGALGDLGCHLVSMVDGLVGPIDSLIADMQTIHETRPLADGSGHARVENEDTATALVRFASGAQGSLSASRTAWGRKNRLTWEVHGTTGSICFDQERMNELRLFQNVGSAGEQGFKTILTGPAHPPYGAFVPSAGHQLGFNDLKVIEVAGFLRHIAGGPPSHPDFTKALEFEKVIHAIAEAARSGQRVSL
ncbi:MAG: Gfo/Idh/MocA family oxidoreductase [Alphaproteobacteria bacterium]|nr:Gfo/Idh/MocA family oxidoreductase [Alphaproteobacteria bacterium]